LAAVPWGQSGRPGASLEVSLSRRIIELAGARGAQRGRLALLGLLVLGAWLVPAPAGAAPVADFTWAPDPAVVDQEITLTAVADPSAVLYRWDLDGDGNYNDSVDRSGPEVTRTFQRARTYTIGLLVFDEAGGFDEAVKQIEVVPADPPPPGPGSRPPDASFVFFPAGPVAGEPITFVSTSSDPDSPIPASGLKWDLNGDGVYDDAEGFAVTTSFPAAGTYTIGLRVTTNVTDEATLALNVGSPGSPGTNVGQSALSFLSPFPVVRIAGRVSGRGVRIRRLTVDAPPGSGVRLTCSGKRCPFKRLRRTISTRVAGGRSLPPTRLLRMRAVEDRLLRPGTVLRLFVTRGEAVGKFTRFRIRKGKSPARADRCLVPGSAHPVACPGR
jgi:PKD repeat protein